MALITRISRLFKADLHAVLDQLEEPDMVLKQSVREMEHEVRQEAVLLQQNKTDLSNGQQQQEKCQQRLQQLDEELDVCFASEQDALAKDLIRRKLEQQAHYAQLSETTDKLQARIKELEQQHQNHMSVLQSMQQKADLLQSRDSGWAVPASHAGISDAEIEIAFLKEKQRRHAS